MALNPLDFSRYATKPDYSGISDIFKNYYQGFEMAQTPEKLARQKLGEELLNSLRGEQISHAQLENQYYPRLKESEIALTEQQAREAEAKARRAQMELDWADVGDDEAGHYPFALMSPGERNQVTKDMREQQKIAQGMVKVNRVAVEMKRLINEHPNVSKQFAAAIAMADQDEESVARTMRRQLANQKDLAAFEKLRKMAAELIFAKGENLGRSFSDAKLRLLQDLKASPGSTDEANLYMLDKEIYDTTPAAAYNKAIQHGLDTRRSVPLDLEHYRTEPSKAEQVGQQIYNGLGGSSDMVTIRNPKTGETKQISRKEYEAAKKR